jgi:hypothetical protein
MDDPKRGEPDAVEGEVAESDVEDLEVETGEAEDVARRRLFLRVTVAVAAGDCVTCESD